jgi:hypothetical protein
MAMRAILIAVAGLLLLTGCIWFLQGIGILPGSFMTGQARWALYGAMAFVLGSVVMALTLFKRRGKAGK